MTQYVHLSDITLKDVIELNNENIPYKITENWVSQEEGEENTCFIKIPLDVSKMKHSKVIEKMFDLKLTVAL